MIDYKKQFVMVHVPSGGVLLFMERAPGLVSLSVLLQDNVSIMGVRGIWRMWLICGLRESSQFSIFLIVREFLDVFPEDLLGVPLDRKVEFRVDLIRGVASIAKALYRLVPHDMQDLSSQLQELLWKESI